MKKFLVYGLIIIFILFLIFSFFKPKGDKDQGFKLVAVKKGTISEKALAVGTIEPDKEIKVKSALSGIISEIYFKVGDRVERGANLFKISPNPTPLEYVEARRNMELAEVALKQSEKEKERTAEMYKAQLIPESQMDLVNSQYNDIALKYKIASERFGLLEKGRIQMSNKSVDSIIKSPISGIILSRNVNEGDPVVPLTQFQPGTDLCSMANMDQMLFKGTVDEIDVGKLSLGMTADIKVGALPDSKVEGKLLRLSPKAKKEGNSTLFDVELSILNTSGQLLRAGYSAVSYINIREKSNILIIPERLVEMNEGKRFVEIKDGEKTKKIEIRTGLSDSLNIEVLGGLKEGQEIIDRPPREVK